MCVCECVRACVFPLPLSTFGPFNCRNKQCVSSDLDRDILQGDDGPETLTVENKGAKVYTIYVHDYSDLSGSTLAGSQATITVLR